MHNRLMATATLLPVLLLASACSSGRPTGQGQTSPEGASPLPQGAQKITLDPADFVTTIDNPYWPMKPGNRWSHRETAGDGTEQRVDVTVTDQTKEILGIRAKVVHDIVREDGQP